MWEKFQPKSLGKAKDKSAGGNDEEAFQGMAEAVTNLAEMLKSGIPTNTVPAELTSLIETWNIATWKKIETLSSRRARRLMHNIDGLVTETMEDEGVELEKAALQEKGKEGDGENEDYMY